MYFLFVDWKSYSKLCSCGICFYYGVQWPKEAWILGQDVSVGFTPTMYTILFPHFWLPLCALLHTTASHPLPIAAICNFSNCIVILSLEMICRHRYYVQECLLWLLCTVIFYFAFLHYRIRKTVITWLLIASCNILFYFPFVLHMNNPAE